MFDKGQLTQLLSLLITLVAAHAVNRQLTSATDAFLSRRWLASSAGVIAGVIVNMQLTPKLLNEIKQVGKYSDTRMVLITDIVNTVVLLSVQRIVMFVLNSSVQNTARWVPTLVKLLAGMTLFSVIFRPLLTSVNSTITKLIGQVVVYTGADYISQGMNESYNTCVSTTSVSSGVALGELSATPIADAIANNLPL